VEQQAGRFGALARFRTGAFTHTAPTPGAWKQIEPDGADLNL
jgi:hypothetical protein